MSLWSNVWIRDGQESYILNKKINRKNLQMPYDIIFMHCYTHLTISPHFLDLFVTSSLSLSMQICRALAYIHNCIGICHRDIKPQNLLVSIFLMDEGRIDYSHSSSFMNK